MGNENRSAFFADSEQFFLEFLLENGKFGLRLGSLFTALGLDAADLVERLDQGFIGLLQSLEIDDASLGR